MFWVSYFRFIRRHERRLAATNFGMHKSVWKEAACANFEWGRGMHGNRDRFVHCLTTAIFHLEAAKTDRVSKNADG